MKDDYYPFIGGDEEKESEIPWIDILERGIIELSQRIVLTNLNTQIYYEIQEGKDKS